MKKLSEEFNVSATGCLLPLYKDDLQPVLCSVEGQNCLSIFDDLENLKVYLKTMNIDENQIIIKQITDVHYFMENIPESLWIIKNIRITPEGNSRFQKLKVIPPKREKIELYSEDIRQLLKIIANATKIPGIESAWISDNSGIGDFFLMSDKEADVKLKKICDQLGFVVEYDDKLHEVARKMKENEYQQIFDT